MSRTGSAERVLSRYERSGIYGRADALGRETEWRDVLREPKYNDMRLLCEDLVRYGQVTAETWQYVEAQHLSLLAERLRTQHVNALTGTYDADRDVLVAAVAGGEELTFEDITATGLKRIRKAHTLDSRLGWQVRRDEIYAANYNGPLKTLVRGESDDMLMYVSTCPTDMDLPEGQDPQGLKDLAKALYYDFDDTTWYMYFAQPGYDENGRRTLTMYNVRMAGSDDQIIRERLKQWGADPSAVDNASLHELGQFVGRTAPDGMSARDVIDMEVAWYDRAVEAKTGTAVSYGRPEASIEAYRLFAEYPELQEASRRYHELLARHIVGDLMDPQLKSYLLSSLEAQERALKTRDVDAKPVITMDEIFMLRHQLNRGRIDVGLLGPCQDMMMYSHTALFDAALNRYKQTGQVDQIVDKRDVLGSYGDAASATGGEATFAGLDFSDCPGTIAFSANTDSMTSAVEMAAALGISIDEAMRRLGQQQRVPHDATLIQKYGLENVRYGVACGACDVKRSGGVGPCGPGFCNDCDTRDRMQPGYIARKYKQLQRKRQLALAA